MVDVSVGAATDVKDLIRAAVAGDPAAQRELIQRHTDLVVATVRRFGLREADMQDAVQNTWVSMIEHLGSLRDATRLAGWLVTIARRECLKIVRQARRCVVGLSPQQVWELIDEKTPGPERSAVDMTMNDLLWTHVARLPPRGRDLIVTLVASDESGYAQYSAATGLPIGSIGPTRMRVLARLRRDLEDAGLGVHAWR
jgi:RNA polymerase sigma factor (sigma-70 family)